MRKKAIARKVVLNSDTCEKLCGFPTSWNDPVILENFGQGTSNTDMPPECQGVRAESSFNSTGKVVLTGRNPIVQPSDVDDSSYGVQHDFQDGFGPKRLSSNSFHPGSIIMVKCTSCAARISPFSCFAHPHLRVIVCKRCFKFYGEGKFATDADGKDENCRWCGDGGDLICCDACSNTFCKGCIKRNLGKTFLQEIENLSDEESWSCPMCNPSVLYPLQHECREVFNRLRETKIQSKRRSEQRQGKNRNRSLITGTPKPSSSKCDEPSKSGPNGTNNEWDFNSGSPRPSGDQNFTGVAAPWMRVEVFNSVPSRESNSMPKAPERSKINTQSAGEKLSRKSSDPPRFESVMSLQPVGLTMADMSGSDKSHCPDDFLKQVSDVTSHNVLPVVRSLRQCVENFDNDLKGIELALSRAGSHFETEAVVKSFRQLYSFNVVDRISNVVSRVNAMASKGLPAVSQSALPETIDLTDEAEPASGPVNEHSSPVSATSQHGQKRGNSSPSISSNNPRKRRRTLTGQSSFFAEAARREKPKSMTSLCLTEDVSNKDSELVASENSERQNATPLIKSP